MRRKRITNPFADAQSFIEWVENYDYISDEMLKAIIEDRGIREIIDIFGLKQIIDVIGPRQVLEALGLQRVGGGIDLDALLAQLTPDQVEELKRRLP